jgi:hypothetical protein
MQGRATVKLTKTIARCVTFAKKALLLVGPDGKDLCLQLIYFIIMVYTESSLATPTTSTCMKAALLETNLARMQ